MNNSLTIYLFTMWSDGELTILTHSLLFYAYANILFLGNISIDHVAATSFLTYLIPVRWMESKDLKNIENWN